MNVANATDSSDDAPAKPYRVEGDVAVVEIVGALDTRGGWWWDGYDLIAQRTAAALADPKVKIGRAHV